VAEFDVPGQVHHRCSTTAGTSTIRMDIHLQNVHKLEKGSMAYQQMMEEASPHIPEDRRIDDLHRALVDFGRVSFQYLITIACSTFI
jgi:hypothetical protein